MSMYFKEHGKPEVKKYTKHGKTKQSQKSECDINKLLERAARTGSLSHLDKYGAQYADFSDYDFEAHVNKIAEGQTMFEQLPAEVKREFDQSPAKFFGYVTNPKNKDRLRELLPEIAERGEFQFPVLDQQLSPASRSASGATDAVGVAKPTEKQEAKPTPDASTEA